MSPNPVNQSATIGYELIKPSDVIFTVYNVLNQLVYSKTVSSQSSGSHEESLDLSVLNPGIYTMTVTSGDAVTTKKFIKN